MPPETTRPSTGDSINEPDLTDLLGTGDDSSFPEEDSFYGDSPHGLQPHLDGRSEDFSETMNEGRFQSFEDIERAERKAKETKRRLQFLEDDDTPIEIGDMDSLFGDGGSGNAAQ